MQGAKHGQRADRREVRSEGEEGQVEAEEGQGRGYVFRHRFEHPQTFLFGIVCFSLSLARGGGCIIYITAYPPPSEEEEEACWKACRTLLDA